MKIGDTFRWSPDNGREHLYIAITDPAKNNGTFVAFNVTRSTGGPKALTLQIGDHPFIRRYPSDVNFGDGIVVCLSRIQRECCLGTAILDAPLRPDLVRKIAEFACGHPAVSLEIERMIIAEWNLPSPT